MFTFTKVLEKRFPRLLGRDRVTGQALRFVVVGGVNTVVDMGIFYLLGLVPGMSLVMAKAISYNLGTVNSFALNKYLTFNAGRSRKGWREFGVFFAINVPPMIIDLVELRHLRGADDKSVLGRRGHRSVDLRGQPLPGLRAAGRRRRKPRRLTHAACEPDGAYTLNSTPCASGRSAP
jgi:putative flippase GtrA